jgi:hypothetical protein
MNNKNIKTLISDLILLSILLVACAIFYAGFDPNEMRSYGVFPWDSGIYRHLAEELHSHSGDQIIEEYPWGLRILFPYIYGAIANSSGMSFANSAYILNIISSILILIFSFVFWRSCGVNRTLCWVGIILFAIYWNGPIRYSGYFPGGGFAFESLIVVSLYLILSQFSKRNIFLTLLISALIFILSCGREFVTHIVLLMLLAKFIFATPWKPSLKQIYLSLLLPGIILLIACAENLATIIAYLIFLIILTRYILNTLQKPSICSGQLIYDAYCNEIKNRNYLNLVAGLIFSVAGHLFSKHLVLPSAGIPSLIAPIRASGRLHLNPLEALYPYFYALGPYFLCLILIITFRNTRFILINRVTSSIPNFDLIFIFCLYGVLAAFFAGTDSDRFLMWFFPFYAVICLKSLEILLEIKSKKISRSLLGIFVVGLLWTRFYVPAIPHLFFPNELYNAVAKVKTNYDPTHFYGPSFMERFRFPLKEIHVEDAFLYGLDKHRDKYDEIKAPMVPYSLNRESTKSDGNPYEGAFEFEINNLPFPFGFPHNQYEFLVAHPTAGDHRVKYLYEFQWVAILLFLVGINNAEIRKRKVNN